MCRKLTYLTSFVLVLGLVGIASAVLPAGWSMRDIGSPGAFGSTNYDSAEGTWTVGGGGHDIWGSSDAFHFAYMPLSGDGQIIARVVDKGYGSNAWSKGGVMIRETLEPDSRHVLMVVTGGNGKGKAFQCRPITGSSSLSSHGGAQVSPPIWIKLTREGHLFTGYFSTDGVTWEQQPDGTDGYMTPVPAEIYMATDVYIGLCVTSHVDGEVRTYTFDNVYLGWPNWATAPSPADGVLHADTWVSLSWLPGDTAVSHDVYIGDDFDNVDTGTGDTFRGNQTGTVFTVGVAGSPYPDGLLLDTTYYWRIDEVEADGTTIHKGEVWSFTVSPMSAEEDFESNNFSTFPWEHHGDASWTITSYEKHSGTYSARAGSIDHEEKTTLQVILDCVSGDITFYRKVYSEGGCDYLEFYIDGVKEDEWSGTVDWDQVSFPVRAGTRTFQWTYSKDVSISEDDDTAWIDDIVFPIGADAIPTGEIIELTDATFDQIVLSSDVPVLVDF